ncbi:orotidine 5'-phosphate decarboxylase [Paenibacillus sp. 19GGS1-52]|uniref:3-hexulose-6-phosphate synthase n=1 Tax=Paenibacillus sp. 19GGS1-52 TaxID=2758563 RepID=UPI001EFBA1C0|nr:3-hexulose-6-phosphate synthase [Paenibacillus sp. 19GGS1-52]ULO07301.1 orotidine 5'-phosphate decarboxylase [Paenibacillus sp. 19GGS1-52]
MNIQLALDRMSITEAVAMARCTEPYIDWIEVGTSLIKEYGMASVEAMRREFPQKVIVADMKTFDNAKYEFELCFKAGADVATVMGAAPPVTVKLCVETAERFGRQTMIDLLHTSPKQQRELSEYTQAIHCLHISKDQQEVEESRQVAASNGAELTSLSDTMVRLQMAAAGGITLESLPELWPLRPAVLIVGSAITKASDPAQAARAIKAWIEEQERVYKDE